MPDGYDELDDQTTEVLHQSADLVDSSRQLMRRIDRLLRRHKDATPRAGDDETGDSPEALR